MSQKSFKKQLANKAMVVLAVLVFFVPTIALGYSLVTQIQSVAVQREQ